MKAKIILDIKLAMPIHDTSSVAVSKLVPCAMAYAGRYM
jgi:hypothetical protein